MVALERRGRGKRVVVVEGMVEAEEKEGKGGKGTIAALLST